MIIRPPAKDEFKQVINCLIETRGADYYSALYYDMKWLDRNIELFAAFDETGELAGIAGLSQGLFNTEKTTGCLLTVRPAFSKHGIAKQLIVHFTDVLKKRGAGAVKGQVVTTHTEAQNIVESLGWIPTGFLYGARHGKNALALYTGKLSGKDVGPLYIHKDITDIARFVYDKLGVTADIQNAGQSGETRVSRVFDAHNRLLYIGAAECGAECGDDFESSPEENTIVMLNLNDPSAVYGYESLREAGYAFCGFDPLGECEQAVFYQGNAPGDMELTEQAMMIRDEVQSR